MADNSELLLSLLEQAEQLPHREKDALTALWIRLEMLIRGIFGEDSFYLDRIDRISLRAPGANIGPTTQTQRWLSGKQATINLVKTMIEHIGEFEPVTRTDVRSKIFIAHDGESEIRTKLEVACWRMGLEPAIVEEMGSRNESVD